ncbi:MAG: hypothetical protein IT335_04195 [Thermomicrobiales bacterium]|nr:hypothetical protein [Thermomicrobiales bacterium]
MNLTRRNVMASMVAGAGAHLMLRQSSVAQGTPEATPRAIDPGSSALPTPGYALARVRTLADASQTQAAVFPSVMADFLPPTRTVEGYGGYVFALDDTNPATAITLTLLAGEASAEEAGAVAQDFVDGLDPRFAVETIEAGNGELLIYETTSRSAAEVPPSLYGCHFTMRVDVTSPGTDIMQDVYPIVRDSLTPELAAMPGFLAYLWVKSGDIGTAINIWETAEQTAAGDQAVRDWIVANAIPETVGTPTVYSGTILFAELAGIA